MMNSQEKPSITGILRPLHGKAAGAVDSTADSYLSYFDGSTSKRNEAVEGFDAEDSDPDGVERRRKDALAVTNAYYDLATDFYEYGWGDAFHFAVLKPEESREHSFAKHEYFLAMKLGLKAGDTVLVVLHRKEESKAHRSAAAIVQARYPSYRLTHDIIAVKAKDIGCGIGGPARHIASLSEANVIGLNINDYQLYRARTLTEKAKLDHLCTFVKADYHHMPYSEGHFDKVYAIEATCHASSLLNIYSEVFRVLKPGGLFAMYEWIMTDKYSATDPYHKKLKADILEGDGLADIVTAPQAVAAAREAGFEVLESRDRAMEPGLPWFTVLQARWTLSDIKITPIGRWATHIMLAVLETAHLAPRGSVKVHRTLCKGADALAAAGVEGIFSPMYLMVLRKPDN